MNLSFALLLYCIVQKMRLSRRKRTDRIGVDRHGQLAGLRRAGQGRAEHGRTEFKADVWACISDDVILSQLSTSELKSLWWILWCTKYGSEIPVMGEIEGKVWVERTVDSRIRIHRELCHGAQNKAHPKGSNGSKRSWGIQIYV
ncbi:hypothetical protein MPTK1_2g00920 [Marchantia polymorpha subsp. ruderalis]|uniref:Uncharacterized protein n=1 Tax=Marchantia polymorpha TaxID=3197 RepID=A0A2R6X9I1_MARPO|nr:hypothetical protein MARPO_0028s0059 [Marchantia polymorpha]BBN00654.1 hypothetical protein Mp_2g00920 [Marchantia polymorpha subsp. ruderalis]|eukprot:PTQ42742.1 hypothetical protein MARPO_0028s0059 [Marchantia polymorpha]